MLEWLSIILLIGVAFILIMVELIFIPGTTIIGLLGLGFLVAGVYLSFDYFGTNTGWIVLTVSSVAGFGIIIYALRSGAWEKLALKRVIRAKFNEEFPVNLEVGQVGKALSALRPMGNAEFDTKVYEVSSQGNYVKTGEKIQIVRVKDNKVFVEPYAR